MGYIDGIHGAAIYGNIQGILMVNDTIYGIHGSYEIPLDMVSKLDAMIFYDSMI